MTEKYEDESIRPWGRYEILLDTEYCKVKRIYVNPNQRLSYQYHHKRQEAWTVVQGVARVTLDDVETDFNAGETVLIPLSAKHRMANPSDTDNMILIEVQTGTYFGEDDIVRIQDDYNRDDKPTADINYPPADWTEDDRPDEPIDNRPDEEIN
tara:strand:+ start:83 stop:541 length:459 start_codon:yes stop_codon:yes gene_type:complete